MLLGADEFAERAEAFGVRDPLEWSMLEVVPRLCEGISVLSKWLEDSDDSLAESG